MPDQMSEVLAVAGLSWAELGVVLDWGDGRPVRSCSVSPSLAETLAARGREAFPATGVWPFLMVGGSGRDDAMGISEASASNGFPAGQAAVEAAAESAAARALARLPRPAPGDPGRPWSGGYDAIGSAEEPLGEVLWVPADHPFEVPGRLGFGGVDGCPAPADQVAIFSFLHSACGAVPIAGGVDRLVFDVVAPPRDKDGVAAVADAMVLLCPALAYDRRGVVSALKAGPGRWQLWWD